jgi:hypothetical protein
MVILRDGLSSLDRVRSRIMADDTAMTSSGLPIYGPRQFDARPEQVKLGVWS